MGPLIPFPLTRIRYTKELDECVCCHESTGDESYTLELDGNSINEKRLVAMCPACHDEMPAWLWKVN